jgi:hypothetical protein
LISIEVKPYTALVGCPVVVEKFSTGSAKNARYATEWPSISSRRGWPDPADLIAGAGLGAELFVLAVT